MADSPRIEELRRRVLVDPASIAFAALAEEYRRAGRFEEAIATCTAGLQRHPAYLSAHVTLGRSLIEIGRFDEGREELEYVLRLAPENLAAIRGLADIHHRRGEHPDTTAPAHRSPVPEPEPSPATPLVPESLATIVPEPLAPEAPGPPPVAEVPFAPAEPPQGHPALVPAPDPAPDPAIDRLEAFLAAIVSLRAERGSAASR